MLPACCRSGLAEQVRRVRHRHERDVRRGGGYVPVPDPIAHKSPDACRDWRYQFLFASAVLRRDDQGRGVRWHTDGSVLERAVGQAARRAGLLLADCNQSQRTSAEAARRACREEFRSVPQNSPEFPIPAQWCQAARAQGRARLRPSRGFDRAGIARQGKSARREPRPAGAKKQRRLGRRLARLALPEARPLGRPSLRREAGALWGRKWDLFGRFTSVWSVSPSVFRPARARRRCA